MANDLVVQLGAKLDQFAADMNQAGEMADSAVSRVESSFASLNPGINTSNIAAGLVIAGGAAAAVITLVAALNKSLADTAMAAERAGLSFERIQQLKFGASAIGVGESDFSGSLDKFVSNLQDAKSKSNDLLRVFQANGVAITDGNGKLRDTNELIGKAVDIIKRAPSIQDALQLGSFLGLSRDFSQRIFDAGDNFMRLASEANKAGAVIDDATINKAREFDREWTKASALWGANMRAALGEILPLLNDAVNGATSVINAVKSVYSFTSAIKDFAISPNIDTASLNQLNSLLKQYEDIKKTLEAGQALNPIQLFQASNIQVDGQVTAESAQKAIDAIKAKIAEANKSLPRVVIQTSPSVNPGIKPQTEQRDAYEVEIDRIEKHIAVTNADTAAAGQNVAVREQLRTEASLYAALERAGIKDTENYADAIYALSERAGQATINLAKANDMTNKINSASSQLGSALSTAFADAIVEGRKLDEVFSSLLKTLEKAAINSLFASFFNAPATGGLSGFASLLGLGNIGHNATGTDSWRGGLTSINEEGPEVVNLPRGSQIIPNSVVKQMSSGAVINNTFNVAGDVSPGTIDRLQSAVMAAHRKADGLAKVFSSTQRMQLTGVG